MLKRHKLWAIAGCYEKPSDWRKAGRTFRFTCKRDPKPGYASKTHTHLQNKENIYVALNGTEEEQPGDHISIKEIDYH